MVNEKKQALALFLQTTEDNIEVSEWDDNTFIVNPHKKTVGHAPDYYKETIEEFRKLLSPESMNAIDRFMIYFATPDYSDEAIKTLKMESERIYKSITPELQGKPVIKDWLYNENILYWLVKGYSDSNRNTAIDLMDAWMGRDIADRRTQEDTNDGEYLVLTEDEADKAYDESLDNYIDGCLEIPDAIEPYFDRERWKDDARVNSSRGDELNRYDGTEEEQEVNGTTYYIYRHN